MKRRKKNEEVEALSADDKAVKYFSKEQLQFFAAVKRGQSVFLTSGAGCGKTFAIEVVCQWLHEKNIVFAATATTGAAATHFGGNTFHAWAGLGIFWADLPFDNLYWSLVTSNETRMRWCTTQVLIIDEISMMPANQLLLLDRMARKIRTESSALPFGGMQIIAVGDFAQLPPVLPLVPRVPPVFTKQQKPNQIKNEEKRYCFQLALWHEVFSDSCFCLTTSFRQDTDRDFAELLSRIRFGRVSKQDVAALKKRVGGGAGTVGMDKKMIMYARRAPVDEYNRKKLEELLAGTTPHVYLSRAAMHSNGHCEYMSAWLRNQNENCQAPQRLEVCRGAEVMLVANISVQGGLVNGLRGTIVSFTEPPIVAQEEKMDDTERGVWPIVFFPSLNYSLPMIPHRWEWSDSVTGATAQWCQIPLRLAWAVTVNKAQGATCDAIHIDTKDFFREGQFYTALSRARTLESVSLSSFSPNIIKADDDVRRFYALTRPFLAETLFLRFTKPFHIPDVLINILIDYLTY